ncbi:MAG: hypothetical protein JXA42_00615 [Anaerolineales bacterium]|nr:hypothetical protein [Anaerolineales bacterium]
MKRISKPTAVNLIMDETGIRRIYHFSWMGKKIPVTALGRTWTDQAGKHVMVNTPGPRIFELLLKADQTWWVLSAGSEEFWV